MTRGTFSIITNDKIYKSIEFNGDMYIDGCGVDAIKCLENIENEDEFEDAIADFDLHHHHYKEDKYTWCLGKSNDLLNLSENYFDKWFSDYIYIKNLSDDVVEIIDKENDTIKIQVDEIAVFNFGKYIDTTNVTSELWETISEEYSSLSEEDKLAIVNNGREVCGIYEDLYDIGYAWVTEVNGIDTWLVNDRYINFEKIGEDVAENTDSWLELPSGKYAHLS